jgi:hypothetical protein
LLNSEDLRIMSTAKDEYTMDDSPDWLFENLDCSREFLRLMLPLG